MQLLTFVCKLPFLVMMIMTMMVAMVTVMMMMVMMMMMMVMTIGVERSCTGFIPAAPLHPFALAHIWVR